jgi:superfamily I DNA/RNA helicase
MDRILLYVACTRAMHRLVLSHAGKPSGFLSSTVD